MCLLTGELKIKGYATIKRVKDRLSFEIWIFRNGQPDRDVHLRIFVAITSI